MVANMVKNKRALLFLTPLVTGSALAASPSIAATLASSQSSLDINNFNISPVSVYDFTDTNMNLLVTDGKISGQVFSSATFANDPKNAPSRLKDLSLVTVNAEGAKYEAYIQNIIGNIGYNFVIPKGGTFSFDFKSDLGLATSLKEPLYPDEKADANGSILVELQNSDTGKILDSFKVSGNLLIPGSGDTIGYQNSSNVTLDSPPAITQSFAEKEKSASASVSGHYSRYFDAATNVNLKEVNINNVVVETPEPSDMVALVCLSLVGLGYKLKSDRSSSNN